VYFYNRFTGSRYLTCGEFSRFDRWTMRTWRGQLREMRRFTAPGKNRSGYPEIDFFARILARFGSASFQALDIARLSVAE